MYTHTNTYTYSHVCIHMHISPIPRIYTHIYLCAYILIYVYICTSTPTYTCIHQHLHTYIHKRTPSYVSMHTHYLESKALGSSIFRRQKRLEFYRINQAIKKAHCSLLIIVKFLGLFKFAANPILLVLLFVFGARVWFSVSHEYV